MPIFTAEISGRPTVVFAALDDAHAHQFIQDPFIRSELQNLLTPAGVSLWDGKEPLTVRPAKAHEHTKWERSLLDDLAAGVHQDRDDAIRSNGFAFLADYREANE